MTGSGLGSNCISRTRTSAFAVQTIICMCLSSMLTIVPHVLLFSNKAVANGAVLSHVNRDNHIVASRVARATYGVVCALPVKQNDKEHIRRKHQWERDPTGECYVPGYFEAKLCRVSPPL